jgi:hypothetical protein
VTNRCFFLESRVSCSCWQLTIMVNYALRKTGRPHHNIVVIGTSTGGVAALLALAKTLPADFPASIFVVLHVASDSPSLMPQLLNGELVRPGVIYLAPPDHPCCWKTTGCWLREVLRKTVSGPPLMHCFARRLTPTVLGCWAWYLRATSTMIPPACGRCSARAGWPSCRTRTLVYLTGKRTQALRLWHLSLAYIELRCWCS